MVRSSRRTAETGKSWCVEALDGRRHLAPTIAAMKPCKSRPRFARAARVPAFVAACAAGLVPASAAAFGGSAPDLGRQGNFVVSNRANLGFAQSFHGGGPSFDVDPELDYFIAPNLSILGAILFNHDDNNPSIGVSPQIGYDIVLSPSWSFWPRLAVTLLAGSPGDVSLELSAPFLIHPVQHFFFGFGPALPADVTPPGGGLALNVLMGEFIIGGYFVS